LQTFEEFYLSVSLFFFREYVETTLFSYRTSQHESTKATPLIHFMCFIKKMCKLCLARILQITTHKNDNLSLNQDYGETGKMKKKTFFKVLHRIFSYRTSQHESTKATPFDALYMRKNSLPWQKKRALVVDFRHHQVHLFTLQKQIIYAQSETGQRTAERTVAL
jgi:hypothetical protein